MLPSAHKEREVDFISNCLLYCCFFLLAPSPFGSVALCGLVALSLHDYGFIRARVHRPRSMPLQSGALRSVRRSIVRLLSLSLVLSRSRAVSLSASLAFSVVLQFLFASLLSPSQLAIKTSNGDDDGGNSPDIATDHIAQKGTRQSPTQKEEAMHKRLHRDSEKGGMHAALALCFPPRCGVIAVIIVILFALSPMAA
jgi:hypothetical protein